MQSWVSGGFKPLITFGWLKGRDRTGKYWYISDDTKLQEIVRDQGASEKRLFLRAKHTGAWLSVWGTTITGTVLAATDFFMCLLSR